MMVILIFDARYLLLNNQIGARYNNIHYTLQLDFVNERKLEMHESTNLDKVK